MAADLPRFVQKPGAVPEENAWTTNEWLCRPGIVAAEKLLMVRATMAPWHCHPFHVHPHREEVLYILQGTAEQWVGQERRILGPGEIAHIPPGLAHATYNASDEVLVFLAVLSPAVLPEELAAVEDPREVAAEAPWAGLRRGLPVCRTRW